MRRPIPKGFWEYAGKRLGISRDQAKRLGYMKMYGADPAAVAALYHAMKTAAEKEKTNVDKSDH